MSDDEGRVRHSHGQHGPHDHSTEDYATHQQPSDDETIIEAEGRPYGGEESDPGK